MMKKHRSLARQSASAVAVHPQGTQTARLVVLFAIAALAAVSLLPAAERELTGRIVDANTGEPIARAHVLIRVLQIGPSAPEATLLSEADGTFKVTNLPDGQYQVLCDKPGYLPVNQMMAAMPPGMKPDDKRTAGVVMKMTAQAAIEGTVVDERDMPANAVVQLSSQQVVNGRRQWQSARSDNTDETGAFRIWGLPAGRYYVSVSARLPGMLATKPLAYPPFFYPSATDIAGAQPVDLKAGDEAEIKIKLPPPVPAYTVSGSVDTTSTSIGLSLVRQPGSQGFQRSSGEISIDQRTKAFRFTHVTPGAYLLQASVWQTSVNPLSTNLPVVVGNSDLTGIRLTPAPTGIDGTVRLEDGTSQRPAGFVSVQSDRMTSGAPLDADGKFHIPSIEPGTYRILPQLNGSQTCVQSVLSGGHDVRDGLTIAAGVAPDPIDIVMSSHCGSIDVSLSPSDATLPPNLMAYLLRKTGDQVNLERMGGFQGVRSSDGAGHFLIRGVAPGDYVVYVWPNDAPIEYTNPEFMRPFESFGQRVTVSADSEATVTVDKPLLLPAKN